VSEVVGARNPPPPESVDEYLALVPPEHRRTLSELRASIHSVAPLATEIISYRMPIFQQQGMLVGFAAFAGHCGFYVMSPAVIRAHARDLRGYDVGKGCIRFPPDKPLPRTLVRKLVKARLAENKKRAAST
jgi:uncharacterized protein YdhG (YjbR/CyaY superfamily)